MFNNESKLYRLVETSLQLWYFQLGKSSFCLTRIVPSTEELK